MTRLPGLLLAFTLGLAGPSAAWQDPPASQDPPVAPANPAPKADEDPLPALLSKIQEQRDAVDADLVRKLGGLRTKPALDGLLESFELMKSLYMKRVVLNALTSFDGVAGLSEPALEKMVDLAINAQEPELRRTAVKALANCRQDGHAKLAALALSKAEDEIREQALEEHTASARPEDAKWYRELYKPTETSEPGKKDKKAKGKKQVDKELPPPRLSRLRVLAFDVIRSTMKAQELFEAAEDPDAEIRGLALEQLESLGDAKGLDLAAEIFERQEEDVRLRVVAAGIVARQGGAKAADRFIEYADKGELPLELLNAMADLVVKHGDEESEKKLEKLLPHGKDPARLFALRALKAGKESKIDKTILKLVDEKDALVVCGAIEALGARGAKSAVPNLEKLLDKSKEDRVRASLIDTLSRLQRGVQAWEQRLVGFATDENPEVRDAALEQIGRMGMTSRMDVLQKGLAHEYWATRLAAVRGLEALRAESVIPVLIGRLEKEEARMQLEIAAALQRLTGRSFGSYPVLWKRWWDEEGPKFHLVAAAGAAPSTYSLPEEVREHDTTYVARFFGTRVRSARVVFVIDVSGSMEEKTRSGESRFKRAQRELLGVVEGLGPTVLFNIITFSSDVRRWLERLSVIKPEAIKTPGGYLEQAKTYIAKLRPGGGTNIYGALKLAFMDPDVDTVYFLTDGEPTVGEVIDPTAIRLYVQNWNKHRKVVINTLAFGSTFPLLQWLAGDSGGTYRYIP